MIDLDEVDVSLDGTPVLESLSWRVEAGQRWVVLGPNGAGKSTLLDLVAAYLHPRRGTAVVLGARLGRTDVRELRRRIGYVGPNVARRLRSHMTARDVVTAARHGDLAPWWHATDQADVAAAEALLERFGCGHLAGHRFTTLSLGERQRTLVARGLFGTPELLLLDEPTAGLDMGGRELLVGDLGRLALDTAAPATVLVTHHVEEIPPAFTHALLLRAGRVVAAGPLEKTVTAQKLTSCFGVPLELVRRRGRYAAWARPA